MLTLEPHRDLLTMPCWQQPRIYASLFVRPLRDPSSELKRETADEQRIPWKEEEEEEPEGRRARLSLKP